MRQLRSCVLGFSFCLIFLVPSLAQAGLVFLDIPSISGEDPIPGHPGAIAVQSFITESHHLTLIKRADKASVDLFLAVATQTPLHTVSMLLYNSTPTGQPVATIVFQDVFATSFSRLFPDREQVDFNFTSLSSMYLELPGIAGGSSTPGHPSLMQIQSFSFAGNDLSVVKRVDSASPDISMAVANQTPFDTASVLFYNSAPSGQPDATLMFQGVQATAYQLREGTNTPLEEDGFSFANIVPQPSLSSAVPEPSSLALLIIGAVGLAGAQSRLRRDRGPGTDEQPDAGMLPRI